MKTRIVLPTMFSGTIKSGIILAMLSWLFFTVGCMRFSEKSGYSEDIARKIIPNQTTLDSVLEIMGPPDAVTQKNGLLIYTYKRTERVSQKMLPLAPMEIADTALATNTTLLIIEIDSHSGIVFSVSRKTEQ